VRLRAESREYLQPHEKRVDSGQMAKKRIMVEYYEPAEHRRKGQGAALSDEELSGGREQGRKRAWAKYYQAHPEKLKAKLAKGKKLR